MVRKDAWYDFNFLKFTEAWFVAQYGIYPGECSMCTWEESVFCCFWMECPNRYQLSLSGLMFHLKACVSLLIFCLNGLSIGVSGVLTSPTITVLLLISCFMAVSICLIYWGGPMLGAYIFTIVISSSWIDPLIIM